MSKGLSRQTKRDLVAYSFIAPNFIGFAVFGFAFVGIARQDADENEHEGRVVDVVEKEKGATADVLSFARKRTKTVGYEVSLAARKTPIGQGKWKIAQGNAGGFEQTNRGLEKDAGRKSGAGGAGTEAG